eukprot:TRINITY_DN51434_c0_g1_i1.p2 TRINITY_DN51434_c0_g1~~TRINITY_DN51434_c0_g1_i1.p2  ORF type:complete len:401 (+),score=184.74 TRINITY_DN51434_c0_g1_i1:45-1205(+)
MAALIRAPGALAQFFGNSMKYRSLYATYHAHLRAKADDETTATKFHKFYFQHLADEKSQMVVFEDLPMSRKDFSQMLEFEEDLNRMMQPAMVTAMSGGLSLAALPLWANAPEKLPSTFFSTEEEVRAAGILRDQEVHIKFAPTAGHSLTRLLEFFLNGEAKHNEAFDSIANGFTALKDPKAIRKMGQAIAKQETCPLSYMTADLSSWQRDREFLDVHNFLGFSHMLHTTEAMTSRLVNHYRHLLQEDVLVKKDVASLTDFELYKLANRRLVARWEEDLNRQQLLSRLGDWWTLTEIKEGEEKVPLRVIVAYQTAFFRDPGFLDQTLESLDTDAFPSGHSWAANAFERRVAFETGPLADHVKAHIEGVKASEADMKAEREKYIAGTA